MLGDAGGNIADSIEVSRSIAKMGSGRRVPCHAELRAALVRLHVELGCPRHGPVCRSESGDHMTAKSVVNWFAVQFRQIGMDGCSSHSGRRTMITLAARSLAQVGGSLRDVQELAGHKNLATTERYIQGDRVIQRRLIELV
ncbi:site-specific integrase [Sphingobium sufflavum]|uniref:tyrosine-type recombinase/integrase n=1 Tax=Sphingobium sufflavum TaxID=1129547 RepID=UPI001F1698CB|nr:site-specific integrase [Sphingobium sufflavum]MCE7795361.1 site-specific integrase [Sphingobium sufflavum]